MYCLRFINNLRRKLSLENLAIDQFEAHKALLILIRFVQSRCFAGDIANLKQQRTVSKELRKLVPLFDSDEVLRVGGRLSNSNLPPETRHPALLPNRHRVTELIIKSTHQKNLHPGRRALQYLLAQNFWILGVQRAIKRTLSRCYRCFRANPRAVQPFMADLPSERVNAVKPFSITGVDFAGPFSVTLVDHEGPSPSKYMYVCSFVLSAKPCI